MKFKQPNHYYQLDDKEQQEWDDFIAIFESVFARYQVVACPKPAISNFYLFASKKKPVFYRAWMVYDGVLFFKLLMIEYEIEWEDVYITGGRTISGTHKYFFGYVTSNRNFGRVFMRPETAGDKIAELFQPVELDIVGFNKFNRKYYLLAENRARFLRTIDRDTLDFLATTRGLQLEMNGQRCLFRLQKALDKKETLKLCQIGHTLNALLNRA